MKLALANDGVYEYAIGDAAAGGNGKWQCLLSRALVSAGWNVVVGLRQHLSPNAEEVVDGIRFVGMDRGNYLAAWSKFLNVERPDWWYRIGAEAVWGALVTIAKAKGTRGIFSAALDSDLQPRKALSRRERWWPLYAWGLKSVDRIFVQHSGQLLDLNRTLQAKASIVPGIVQMPRDVKSFGEREKYVVWAAFLRETKRPEILIEMARNTPDIRYVVCGGSTTYRAPVGYSERITTELQSLPNVNYLGHVSQDKIPAVMSNAAALLCTSYIEGFPNTFLEAWAAGTPVVSLSIDPGGVIKEKGLGFVSVHAHQAASDLRALLSSAEVFNPVSVRARRYVEDVHSGEAVARVFNRVVLNGKENGTPSSGRMS